MTIQQAKDKLGDRAEWELRNMIKALSFMGALNTPEEDERLRAAKILVQQSPARSQGRGR